MKVDIYSINKIRELIKTHVPQNAAIISFYSKKEPFDFSGVCDRVFYVMIPDIDIELLSKYGYTYETYMENANSLAEFIYDSKQNGLDIICQCDYGQSRSAACAAAILQHFEGRGIDIFADYRYYPNQLVYHKVTEALERYKRKQAT